MVFDISCQCCVTGSSQNIIIIFLYQTGVLTSHRTSIFCTIEKPLRWYVYGLIKTRQRFQIRVLIE
jgi:hypothetical protein